MPNSKRIRKLDNMNSTEVINALKGTRISLFSPETRRSLLLSIVKSLYKLKSMDDEKDLKATEISRVLDAKLMSDFGSLTMEEVKIALEAGVCGDFETNTAINIGNICNWLKCYIRCDARMEAKRILERSKEPIKVVDPEVLRQKNLESARRCLANLVEVIKENNPEDIYYHFVMHAGMQERIYNILRERGYMKNVSEDTIREARKEVDMDTKRRTLAGAMTETLSDSNARYHSALLKRWLTVMVNAGKQIVI